MSDDDDLRFRFGAHRLRERLIQTMVCELDRPYVVVCRSRTTDRISLLGPYAVAVIDQREEGA